MTWVRALHPPGAKPAGAAALAHERKVARIARELASRTSTRPLSLRKRAVSHRVPKLGDRRHFDDRLDISDLDAILAIDPDTRTCVAEPGVTFVRLVAATMRHGLVPVIVPELKTITIGGAVAGCSIESTSFRYGGFHDSCLAYELITTAGEVLTVTPEDLVFQMMHGSFGTLGILSKLRFRLLPAQPFVHVRYETHRSLAAYQAAIWRHYRSRDVDFMDGIIHAPDEWVLSLARFATRAPYTSRYDWTKIYWKSTRERSEDYLRTPDYFFRYDHGVTNVHPTSRLGRFLVGRFTGSTPTLWLAERMPWLLRTRKPTITLDVFVPFSKAEEYFDWYEQTIGYYPLWCVPYRIDHPYEWLSDAYRAALTDELFLDLAIYGMKHDGSKNYHKLIEEELMAIGGVKTLISDNHYSEGDFWRIFNKDNYDRAKAITDPKNLFRDLYGKTCRAAMGLPG